MRFGLASAFLSFLFLPTWNFPHDGDWRQIVPLRSTRADVERLLWRTDGAYFATYRLKEGNLFIEYSSGPCRPERKGGWNVPKDVVISVSFSPKLRRRINDLKLDSKKYKNVIDDHLPGIFYMINSDDGITYEVQAGKVYSVEYGPTKKDQHLSCGEPSP